MIKRYVQVTIKSTNQVRQFPTITEMYAKLGEKTIGVTRNSLWNALSKSNGRFENGKVKVEYRKTKKMIWK